MKKSIYLLLFTCLIAFNQCKNNQADKLQEISVKLQTSFDERNFDYINNLISVEEVMENPIAQIGASYRQMKELVKRLKAQGMLDMERFLFRDGEQTDLRVISSDKDKITVAVASDIHFINYIDFKFENIKGTPRIVDFYLYQQGYSFSEEMEVMAVAFAKNDFNPSAFMNYQMQVKSIRGALDTFDVEMAKLIFEGIDNQFRGNGITRSLHIAIASYDANSNLDGIIQKYLDENPEQKKYVSYLELLRSVHNAKCTTVKAAAQNLWTHTGVDSFTLDFYEECLENNNGAYIVN